MLELFQHWPASAGSVELWGGTQVSGLDGHPGFHSLNGLGRDHRWLQRYPWSKRYELEQLDCLWRAIWKLQRRRADIVYCGDPTLTWHLKRFQRFHGAAVVFMNGMRLSSSWANHFDGVHLIADPYLTETQEQLGDRMRAHFFAVPHFVDHSVFRPASAKERSEARAALRLPEDAFIVLTVGPIGDVSGKRLDFLAQEIAQASPRIHLLHAGSEEDGGDRVRRTVNECLGNRVHWLGKVSREGMPQIYQAANAYSLGSLAEPFSIAIVEAMASGLPVIHHQDHIMRWVVGPGGKAVSMQHRGEAASALQDLASSEDYGHLASAARQWAMERYAPEAICKAIGDQLQETLRLKARNAKSKATVALSGSLPIDR